MSHKPRRVTGIPTAGPFTAATKILGKSMKAATKSLKHAKLKIKIQKKILS